MGLNFWIINNPLPPPPFYNPKMGEEKIVNPVL
jgi:hypothetical protein